MTATILRVRTPSDQSLAREQERAATALSEREADLRSAQERVRAAGEGLRRALRAAKAAEAELGDAERRVEHLSAVIAKQS